MSFTVFCKWQTTDSHLIFQLIWRPSCLFLLTYKMLVVFCWANQAEGTRRRRSPEMLDHKRGCWVIAGELRTSSWECRAERSGSWGVFMFKHRVWVWMLPRLRYAHKPACVNKALPACANSCLLACGTISGAIRGSPTVSHGLRRLTFGPLTQYYEVEPGFSALTAFRHQHGFQTWEEDVSGPAFSGCVSGVLTYLPRSFRCWLVMC